MLSLPSFEFDGISGFRASLKMSWESHENCRIVREVPGPTLEVLCICCGTWANLKYCRKGSDGKLGELA